MLTLVDPTYLVLVIGVIGQLIMIQDDGAPHLGPMWKILKVHTSPLAKSGLQFHPGWEKHILAVSHHILLFMSVYELTIQILGPLISHDTHPMLHHHEQYIY